MTYFSIYHKIAYFLGISTNPGDVDLSKGDVTRKYFT